MASLVQYTTGIRAKLVTESYADWLKKNDRVLDVGCGDGILTEILINAFAIKVTGCDIDNYLRKSLPFVPMNKEFQLPFREKSFDVVMFNDTLHHMITSHQDKLLKEAFRVSDRVLIFEDEPTLTGTVADWTINKFHSVRMPVTLTFRSHFKWIKLFESLGAEYDFREVRKQFFYPFTHEAFYLHKSRKKK